MDTLYRFNLPAESDVIKRNGTITTYYAQLYKSEPVLYKWAGLAAFASFHIGEKLKMWNWESQEIKSFSETCTKKNKSIEDDFQIIRILNNKIFLEIGSGLLAFSQLDFKTFKNQLVAKQKDEIILNAFEKLNQARTKLDDKASKDKVDKLIWEANVEILWHEQSKVVQPLFDKLSFVFSGTMSFIASFDYQVNHKKTNWKLSSRFFLFMIWKGFQILLKNRALPDVTNLDQRWFWISSDILKKWKIVEIDKFYISKEIDILSNLEIRKLTFDRNGISKK